MREEIKKYTNTNWLGKNIIYEPRMGSTNVYAKQIGVENVTNGTVVVTELQTAGQGRKGRNWISPKGNCYFSMLLKTDIQPENASRITLVVALALVNVIKRLYGLDAKIKWPNDVVVSGRKVSGILTESSISGNILKYIIVGIGVNANQTEFDLEIQNMATSIRLESGEDVDCARLIGNFLTEFEWYYNVFLETEDLKQLMSEYNNLLVNRGREVKIIDKEERIMTALGIDETGALMVKDREGNTETIISGEVSVRGMYGYV